MSRVAKIARRSFLFGSIAVVGGMAIGGYAVTRPAPNPLSAGTGEAALTPFVFIDQNGVTLIAPRAEMGQGIRTTLAALIAEELDVDIEAVSVIHGPAAQAYYNAALLTGLPHYDPDQVPGFIETEMMGTVSKLMGLQVTGGSTSTKDGFVKMREAGAAARETLKEAAAQRLGMPRDTLMTNRGMVIAADGTRLSYTELASDAAQIDLITDVDLRDPSKWRYIGKSVPRVDMVEKVTGKATFGIDVRLPGMKFATLKMNPAIGGGMTRFDASKALAQPGVDAVVDMDGGFAVVANNTWIAEQAAQLVVANWGSAPYPARTEDMFETIEAAFSSEPNSTFRDRGDLAVVPDGAQAVTATYKMPFLAHATMEPMNATAHYVGGKLTIWSGNQGPTVTRDNCADAVGLDPENVEMITTLMGGGFGRRAEIDFSVAAAKLAVAMEGVPVQLTWSREEDFTHDVYRPAAIGRFRGAVKDGEAVLLDGEIAAQSCDFQFMERIGGPSGGEDKTLVDGSADQPYGIPNYRIRGYIAEMAVPVGLWRSVGYSVNGFLHDTFIDEMAHAAGADPLSFRHQMIKDVHAPSAGALAAVREMSGWTGQTPDGIGMGVGFTYSFGTSVAIVFQVADRDGEIHVEKCWIACDIGQAVDPEIVEAQMISGMVYGLSAACYEEITFADGQVEQLNYPDYEPLRIHQMPETQVQILETNPHMGGAGEPSTPPAMPAIGNALFDLTGTRARELPLRKTFKLAV